MHALPVARKEPAAALAAPTAELSCLLCCWLDLAVRENSLAACDSTTTRDVQHSAGMSREALLVELSHCQFVGMSRKHCQYKTMPFRLGVTAATRALYYLPSSTSERYISTVATRCPPLTWLAATTAVEPAEHTLLQTPVVPASVAVMAAVLSNAPCMPCLSALRNVCRLCHHTQTL